MDILYLARWILAAFPLLIFLVSCGRSERTSEESSTLVERPPGWQTICLERFLIDLPGSVEVAAAEPLYRGVYGFDGIDDLGGAGQRWKGVRIIESEKSTVDGLHDVYIGAFRTIGSQDDYRD